MRKPSRPAEFFSIQKLFISKSTTLGGIFSSHGKDMQGTLGKLWVADSVAFRLRAALLAAPLQDTSGPALNIVMKLQARKPADTFWRTNKSTGPSGVWT